MAVKISVKIFSLGVFDPFRELHALCILSRHVDQDIGRNPVFLVGQPLNRACIGQGSHPDRLSLVIDLGIIPGNLKLGNHIHHTSHLPVAQQRGGVPVQQGDGLVIDLLNVVCKLPLLNGEKPLVFRGIEERR